MFRNPIADFGDADEFHATRRVVGARAELPGEFGISAHQFLRRLQRDEGGLVKHLPIRDLPSGGFDVFAQSADAEA